MNPQKLGENQSNLLPDYKCFLDSIGKIYQKIYQGKNLQTFFNLMVIELQNFLKIDRILVYEKSIKNLDRLLSESLSSLEMISFKNIQYNSWKSAQVLEQLKQEKIFNSSELDSSIQDQKIKLGIKSELIVPILIHKSQSEKSSERQLWGIIVVHQCYQRDWQAFELDFLTQIAQQAAIAVQQTQLLTQLQAVQDQLKEQEIKDDLTQVANYRYFNKILEIEWKRLQRESFFLSLILCKVDGFEHYNQIYGNEAGDSCLQLVASILVEMAKRPADLVARYDQQTFGIILPNTHPEGSVKVAEAIRTRVHLLKIPHRDFPISSYLTLSLGVSSTVPTLIQNVKSLIKLSEEALKQATKEGNRVLIFPDC